MLRGGDKGIVGARIKAEEVCAVHAQQVAHEPQTGPRALNICSQHGDGLLDKRVDGVKVRVAG